MREHSPEVAAFVDGLRAEHVVVEVHPDGSMEVPPRGEGGPAAELALPEELLLAFLDDLGRSHAPFDDDARGRARGLITTQTAGQLLADHGGGVNLIQRVSLLRDDVGVHLVEERLDDVVPPGGLPDGPHDDPGVFGIELAAVAVALRRRGLDVLADPDAATLRVGPTGRGPGAREVEVVLRPDLYRAHLDAEEAEYAEVLDEPRLHAWRCFCRGLGYLLTDTKTPRPPMRRLSFGVTGTGDTGLVREPPGEPLVWRAEPGQVADEAG